MSALSSPILDDELNEFDADDHFGFGKPAEPAATAAVADESMAELRELEIAAMRQADAASGAPGIGPAGPALNPVAAMIAQAEASLGEISVPRIAIHVFACKPETAEMAEAAAVDRRLQRATTTVKMGGLQSALETYANAPTPSLMIIESLDRADVLLAGLDKLAEYCDPGAKVVVIGDHNDISLYRELMRRGVSEYLVPPLAPLQIIRTITGLYADPSAPFVGRTLAFVGAKGGVGASTLAHNIAHSLAEVMKTNTVIADMDLAFGTAGLDFNQDPIQGMGDALAKPDRLDQTLLDRMTARCGERLSLFAAPVSLDDDYDIPVDAFEEVGQKIRSSAPYVVLDLPHLWSGWMRQTLLSSDDLVIVATPDLASLRNTKNLMDLVQRARPNDNPPHLILNMVGVPGRPEIPVKEFAKALGREPALVLPFDPKLFGSASNNGQMINELNPKAKSSEALVQFAQVLSRREAPAPAAQKSKSILSRFVKKS